VFITEDGEAEISQIGPRRWKVLPRGGKAYEVSGKQAAIDEARGIATGLTSSHLRELQEKQRRLQSSLAEPPKRSHAQIKREIDAVLAKKPGSSSSDGPRILKISRGKSFADRRVFVVDVQYPGEEPMRVEFTGPSRDIVGPVVMVLDGGRQMFVHDPSRFGTFGQDWIRHFYA
jgi:hypothetical protein